MPLHRRCPLVIEDEDHSEEEIVSGDIAKHHDWVIIIQNDDLSLRLSENWALHAHCGVPEARLRGDL